MDVRVAPGREFRAFVMGAQDCKKTAAPLASVLGQRAKSPSSQARLIESTGGDPKTMEYVRETHERFVGALVGLATGGGIGGAKNLAAKGAEVAESGFFQGARYTPKVLEQMR